MEETKPPVCPQTYDAVSAVPRVLTCGHTACEACLKELPSTLRCTACTLLGKIPNSISAIPQNNDLLQFSSALQHRGKNKKVNSPSPPPESGKNMPDLFPLNMESWSHEFYCRWKKWVIPKDCILIENLGPGKDGGVVNGKILKSFESGQLMGLVYREKENAGLVKVGIFVEDQEDSKLFKFSYESRIVTVLCRMKEDERDELGRILNVSLGLGNVGKACGFWYNEDDNSVYTVWQKCISPNLRDFVLDKKGNEEKKVTRDDVSGLGMLGMEMCETLGRLHSEGLAIGFLSVSCFGFDDFGCVCMDLSEVLNMGNRLKNNLLNENLVLISPEMLLQFVNKDMVDHGKAKSRHELWHASDVWSLASLLVWLIVGSSYLEETEYFLKLVLDAIKDEKGCDYSGLHMYWMKKISQLLKHRLGPECDYLQECLCKCLGFDPANRPVVTELWKCLRGLIIKPQLDIGLSLRQEGKKENPGNCIVLGETFHVVNVILKELINDMNGNDKNEVAGGDVAECVSRGRVKCIEMKGHLACISGLAVGGHFLFTSSYDMMVRVWSLQDYTLSCEMSGHKKLVSSLVVSGGVLFSGSWDGTVRLWSLSDHSPLSVLGEEEDTSVLSLSADHNLLFVGHTNGIIKIWHNDTLVKSTQAQQEAVFSISNNGKWLFTGGWDSINLQQVSEDEDGVEVTPVVGSIRGNSLVGALLYWNGKLFVGQGNGNIKVYHGV